MKNETPQKQALIFGVTGQDGSYLTEFLLAKGYLVTGVARRVSVDTTERLCPVKYHPNFRLVQGDVTDSHSVHRLINERNYDEVYNLAAQSHVGVSFQEPAHTWNVVAGGCLNILEAVYQTMPAKKPKVYQASSSEMFGSAFTRTQGPSYQLGPSYQSESTPMLPNSPYAVAKLAAHNMVRVYRDSYGLFACSGILFNHESPRRGDNFVTKKISLWVSRLYHTIKTHCPTYPNSGSIEHLIRNNPSLKIKLGNLDAYRDWGWAPDYVEAMWLMLQAEQPNDFVIASGETHKVYEFVYEALDVIGFHDSICTGNLTMENLIETDSSMMRPNEVPFLRGDATKAKNYLGWEPKVKFKDLVKNMVISDLGETVVRRCKHAS